MRLYRLGDHLERIEKPGQAERLGARHAHRRRPEGSAGRFGHAAHRRGGSDERRRRQQRRHRSGNHLRHQAPAHSRFTPSVSAARSMAHDIEVTDVQLPARSLAKSRLEAAGHLPPVGIEGREGAPGGARFGKDFDCSRHCSGRGRRRANRNGAVQRRRRRSEEPAILDRRAARRGKQEQQRRDARPVRGQRQAACSVYGRRAALGLSSSCAARWKTTRISTSISIVRTTQNKTIRQVPGRPSIPN